MRVDRNQQDGKCIVDLTTDGRVINEAALVSIAANEMVLNWTERNDSSRVRMQWMALGGDAIENVELFKVPGRTSAGRNIIATSGGWQPRSLLTFSAYNLSVDGNHSGAHINLGACTAPTAFSPTQVNQQVSFYSEDGVTNSNVSRRHSDNFICHHNYDTVLEEVIVVQQRPDRRPAESRHDG